ncbi:MAG: hypothetical protein MAG471_01035 [Acidimicrobiaceae bacterium]|nr:hypothetical protein [Acidimicrobiaceae bacterium]
MALELVGVAVRVVGNLDGDVRRNPGLNCDHRVPFVAHLQRGSLERSKRQVQWLSHPEVVGSLQDEVVTACRPQRAVKVHRVPAELVELQVEGVQPGCEADGVGWPREREHHRVARIPGRRHEHVHRGATGEVRRLTVWGGQVDADNAGVRGVKGEQRLRQRRSKARVPDRREVGLERVVDVLARQRIGGGGDERRLGRSPAPEGEATHVLVGHHAPDARRAPTGCLVDEGCREPRGCVGTDSEHREVAETGVGLEVDPA